MSIICSKTFRAHMVQRFRYNRNGQDYVLTQTKGGKTTVWILQRLRPAKSGNGCLHEVWRKCDADESAEAINEIAVMHAGSPSFTQFFAKPG